MLKLNYKKLPSNDSIEKNVLYHLDSDRRVAISEIHEKSMEIVYLNYTFQEGQYALLGKEYRSSNFSKEGCKLADIMTCVIDEEQKGIYSFILDIKKDISAFSDDLFKEEAMITVIKEVRDFIKQLHDENLCKNSLLIPYFDEDYKEMLAFGIATTSFETEKFIAAADFLEQLNELPKSKNMQDLVWMKLKNSLNPYTSEIPKLKDFAKKKVCISGRTYDLNVYILEQRNEKEYVTMIPMKIS